ncbi:dTDP-4-dehydrorhamnose 3,5-epimerase [Capilliphycus salinus ALCB114379]|uniref:dTDP-4-dehydrorhamnose 3,5-epimerase n=1 Tax=Capilliphycus salinus TaxID=2768948 RepID=UPI0039A46D18
MSLTKQVEIRSLESIKTGMIEFYTPQTSHETLLVQVEPGAVENLFVHHFQTDQLLGVRGSFVIAVLQNRRYHYIPVSDRIPAVIQIPPGVPHGAINLSSEPCLVVNAVLRHGEPHERDYRPMLPPLPYDFVEVESILRSLNIPITLGASFN